MPDLIARVYGSKLATPSFHLSTLDKVGTLNPMTRLA